MTGQHHVVCGAAAYVAVSACAPALMRPDGLGLVLGVAGAVLGSLLPDIDTPDSIIGRYVHLPIEHRTWTHAIWIPALLFVTAIVCTGLLCPLLWGLAVGYFAHLIADAVGRAGICWLYPLSNYKRYDSGAFIARGHHIKLYHNGELDELLVVLVVVAICAVVWWLTGEPARWLGLASTSFEDVQYIPVVL